MTDGYGRSIDYLRISLTDKCSLRCSYCMPKEGIRHLSHSDILTLEEIHRLVRIMTGLGVKRVRLTGGEPLVRKGVVDLVRMLSDRLDSNNRAEKSGLSEIVMTTNGIRLYEMAGELKEAGLSGVNISLDTLNRDTFIRLTGSGELGSVLSGIEAAKNAGLLIKINCVPIRGINESEAESLVRYAGELGVEIRFIELMPLGCGARLEGIKTEELIGRFEKSFGTAIKDTGAFGGEYERDEKACGVKGPAEYYRFEGYDGRIGFISPMSHAFCENCNRIRLTAEGFLKLCLQYPDGIDLKALLRGGAADDEIKHEIEKAVCRKPSSHSFSNARMTDERKMIQIGG